MAEVSGAGAAMDRRSLDRALTTVVLVIAWGSTFAALKIGLESAPPLVFAGLRAVLATAVLVPVAIARGGRPGLRATWGTHLALGLTNVALFFGLQTYAILELPTGLAAVLIYLQPVLVGLLAWRFLHESMGAGKVLGLLLGLGGIVVVSSGAIGGDLSVPGIFDAVGSALAWAVGTVILKATTGRVDPWWAVAVQFAIGSLVLLPAGVVVEGADVDWSWRFVGALAYAGLVGTTLAWVLWLRLLTSGEATRAATYIFFVPLLSVVLGAVLLDETVGLSLVLGAALVGVGVYLVNRPPRRRV